MDYAEFQKRWETEAKETFNRLIEHSEEELLLRIKKNQKDDYYQIWRALSFKGSKKSIKTLYQIVSNLNEEYLTRYHACEALFHLAGIDNEELKRRVQYGRNSDREEIDQVEAIGKLAELLSKSLK